VTIVMGWRFDLYPDTPLTLYGDSGVTSSSAPKGKTTHALSTLKPASRLYWVFKQPACISYARYFTLFFIILNAIVNGCS